jgi:hypothetical protein
VITEWRRWYTLTDEEKEKEVAVIVPVPYSGEGQPLMRCNRCNTEFWEGYTHECPEDEALKSLYERVAKLEATVRLLCDRLLTP